MTHVLVVEDDRNLRQFLRKALREEGVTTDEAATGEIALVAALAATYDCIILDVMLPGRDGFEVLAELRAQGSGTAQLFALAFVVIGAAMFAATRTRDKGRVPQEAIIGSVYVVASAAALLVADKAPRGADAIKDVLVGTILWVTWPTIAKLAVAYTVLGAILFFLRRRFETISFDETAAAAKGWHLRWWDFAFYCIFGIVITFSVPLGGVLLVFSFLVVPAVTAFLFTRHPMRLTVIAFCTGTVASALGLTISYQSDLPTGPTIVCSYGAVLALAAVVRKFMPVAVG